MLHSVPRKRLSGPALGFALALSLLSAGCVSVLPEPVVPAALISLPADRAKPPVAPLEADVTVYPPDSARSWAGSDIAVANQQELIFLSDVRWADTGPRLLQIAVVDALSGASGSGRAMTAQQATRTDYDLRWRIVDLSVSPQEGPVQARVEATLVDSQTRRVVAQQVFSADGRPTGRSQRERAAALAVAAQNLADQVAAFVAAEARPKTPAATPH